MQFIVQNLFAGFQVSKPSVDQVVHVFDVDDTLTCKPEGFDNTGLTRETFFDAARSFLPDASVLSLLRLMQSKGDAIAIATARPLERLEETVAWLTQHGISYDFIALSNDCESSSITKQEVIQYLKSVYRMVGTLVDDSPYNCEGARLQGVDAIHVTKNCDYWAAHVEPVWLY
jgi:hypothetical protein